MLTLGELYEIGIHPEADAEAKRRFQNWKDSETPCYASEEEARKAAPAAFQEVETRYGWASLTYREYPLQDGRVVVKKGFWDYNADHGVAVFYFAS